MRHPCHFKAAILCGALVLPLSARAKSQDDTPIRFLTYNVAGIPITHGRVAARTRKMAAILERRFYDIAAFQECWFHQCAQTLGRRFMNRVRAMDGILGGDGLLLGTRFPVLETSSITYSLNAPLHRLLYGEADGFAAKGAIAAKLQTPDGPLKVFDTHLIAGYPYRDYVPERISQVYELSRFVRRYAGRQPYAILGDMNFSPDSTEYKLLVSLLGLRDACPRCAPTDADGLIDHILLSPSLARWTVAATTVTFNGTLDAAGKIPLSDHKALAIELLPPRPGAPAARVPPPPMTRRQALLAVVEGLDGFIQQTARALRENLLIPFYGWSHAHWALAQIEAAWRIQNQALADIASENAALARKPAAAEARGS